MLAVGGRRALVSILSLHPALLSPDSLRQDIRGVSGRLATWGPPFVMGPWKGSDTTAKVPRSMPRVCLSEHVQLRGLRPTKDIGSNFEYNTLSLALSLSLDRRYPYANADTL